MPQARSRKRVLIVDDEHIIASTLGLILQREGFDAISFTKPLDALRAAGSDAPDLLITDVVMPILSGIELAIQVRECCPDCKILLFSGQAGTSELIQLALSNGHSFELLSKPVHPAELLKKIQSILD
jgi:DNA-binding response OmpR family regulator